MKRIAENCLLNDDSSFEGIFYIISLKSGKSKTFYAKKDKYHINLSFDSNGSTYSIPIIRVNTPYIFFISHISAFHKNMEISDFVFGPLYDTHYIHIEENFSLLKSEIMLYFKSYSKIHSIELFPEYSGENIYSMKFFFSESRKVQHVTI